MAVAQRTTGPTTVTGLVGPSSWACPKCGVTVRTLVPTYVPWCSNIKHRRDVVAMVVVPK